MHPVGIEPTETTILSGRCLPIASRAQEWEGRESNPRCGMPGLQPSATYRQSATFPNADGGTRTLTPEGTGS